MNSVDSSPSESESESTDAVVPKISLYLFYEHYGSIELSNSLYKIDLDLTRRETEATDALDLPPTLELKNVEPLWIQGMRCARLGSKLYFLGGTMEDDSCFLESPQDVRVFDMLTGDFKTMDARLNAGKPDHCVVFAGNGKVYALGSIPDCPPEELPPMMLFECFDPSTGKWEVLDDLPPVGMEKRLYFGRPSHKGVHWGGCIVLRKRQQVVVLGREFSSSADSENLVAFVYDLQQGTWTKLSYSDVGAILSFQEGEDEDYLYGAPYICGPPVKSKRECISSLHEMDSCDRDGVVHMSIPGVPTKLGKGKNYAKWVYTFFRKRYAYPARNLLRYLGNGYFCYIATGMLTINHDVYDDGVEFCDPSNRGIAITVFKEIKGNRGEELCFQAEILYSQDYVIRTPNVTSIGRLVECFVVDLEKMQKNVYKKKNDKKKKKKNKKEEKMQKNVDKKKNDEKKNKKKEEVGNFES